MGGLRQWEDIDHPIWVVDEEAEDPNDRVDGVGRFFDYLISIFHSYLVASPDIFLLLR